MVNMKVLCFALIASENIEFENAILCMHKISLIQQNKIFVFNIYFRKYTICKGNFAIIISVVYMFLHKFTYVILKKYATVTLMT